MDWKKPPSLPHLFFFWFNLLYMLRSLIFNARFFYIIYISIFFILWCPHWWYATCFDCPRNISLPSSPAAWLRSLKGDLKIRICTILWADILKNALQTWATKLSTALLVESNTKKWQTRFFFFYLQSREIYWFLLKLMFWEIAFRCNL